MLFKSFYSVIIRTHSYIIQFWKNGVGLSGKCNNVPSIKREKGLCRELVGSLWGGCTVPSGSHLAGFYNATEGFRCGIQDDVSVLLGDFTMLQRGFRCGIQGDVCAAWHGLGLTGVTAGREGFALSRGIHWEHCSSRDIPYSLEAGHSYWETLQHKDEHPVTQTGVGLCHLLNFSSRALTAKKLHAPNTLL